MRAAPHAAPARDSGRRAVGAVTAEDTPIACGSRKTEKVGEGGGRPAGLLGLPVLRRLGTWLDAFEIGIHAVGARGYAGLLGSHFLPFRLLLGASFLALALALALLLRGP